MKRLKRKGQKQSGLLKPVESRSRVKMLQSAGNPKQIASSHLFKVAPPKTASITISKQEKIDLAKAVQEKLNEKEEELKKQQEIQLKSNP